MRVALPLTRVRVASLLALVLSVTGSLGGGLAEPAWADDAWRWPLSPRPVVARTFEAPQGPYSPGHRGVDLLGAAGQPVLAVADGTVAYAGRVAGIGVVSIDTAAGRVTYQPVVASVRRGDAVVAGSTLGELSTIGGHCVPRACLHLGLVVADEYRDPLALLGGGPVRLLPVDGPLAGALPPPLGTGDDAGRRSVWSAAGSTAALSLGVVS